VATFFSVGLFELISVAVCDHAFSRSVRWSNTVGLLNDLSKRLGLCATSGIVLCGLGLGYLSWLCILVWCAGLRSWVNGIRGFQELSWFETHIISLSLREVDYLILFESCGMRKTLRCNLRNVPQVKFRKIHLQISAFCKVHLTFSGNWPDDSLFLRHLLWINDWICCHFSVAVGVNVHCLISSQPFKA